MIPQEYILSRLESIKTNNQNPKPKTSRELVDYLYKAVMNKKFRKYSVNPEYQKHIRSAVELNIQKKEPIKITFVFGAYKLWRLEEAPEPDWGELFSMIYYANWLKPIAEVYEPGVWFDFYAENVIVEHIDNIPREDTERYSAVFRTLLNFLKPYLSANMRLTLNRVGDQYASEADFLADLKTQMESLRIKYDERFPPLTEKQKATLELNVRLKPEQDNDPEWREKVQLIHDAYMMVTKRRPYFRVPDKISAVATQYPNTIAVGTTKTSIAKFWPGVGVLKKQEDDFAETILSPNQLQSAKFTWEPISINGLEGKNFKRIRILD